MPRTFDEYKSQLLDARHKAFFSTMSIEHCLRDMWQAVLWENWEFVRDENDNRHHQPVDRQLATLWHVWSWRHEMILSQGTETRRVSGEKAAAKRPKSKPFCKPYRNWHWGQFARDEEVPTRRGIRPHPSAILASKRAVDFANSYLAPFLDAPLPAVSNALSCRDLQRIWCVVETALTSCRIAPSTDRFLS